EFVAGCLAEVFSLEDALKVIAHRARLMHAMPGGEMRAVRLSEAEVAPYLGDGVSLAAVNSPKLSVVSGSGEAIERFEARVQAAGLETIVLHTSHAFHSDMMEPVLPEFGEILSSVQLNLPKVPIVSTVSGRFIAGDELTAPDYWVQQLRQTVRFSDALETAFETPGRIYLEVGPGKTLSNSALQHKNRHEGTARLDVIDSLGHPKKQIPAGLALYKGIGRLWQTGVDIDWARYRGDDLAWRVPLPTYPFQRSRYWIDPPQRETNGNSAVAVSELEEPPTQNWLAAEDQKVTVDRLNERVVGLIEEAAAMRLGPSDYSVPFIELGFDSLLLTQVSLELKRKLAVNIPFRRLLEDEMSLIDVVAVCEAEGVLNNGVLDGRLRLDDDVVVTGDSVIGLREQVAAQQKMLAQLMEQQAMILAVVEEQKGLLARLVDPEAESVAFPVVDQAAAYQKQLPLTADQQGIWLNSQLSSYANSAYNVAQLIYLDGPLDVEKMIVAVRGTFAAHDSYRLRFLTDGNHQVIIPAEEIELPILEFEEDSDKIDDYIRIEATRPFDLENGPVARAAILCISGSRHALLYVAHHIVTDGWSSGVLMDEIHARYAAATVGRRYADPSAANQSFESFVTAHNAHALSEQGRASLGHWVDHLTPLPEPIQLPGDFPRPDVKSYRGDAVRLVLEADLTHSIREASRTQKTTFFNFLFAAYKTLLYRLTHQSDLIVGVPLAGQTLYNMPTMTGFLVHYLPLRTGINGELPFGTYLKTVQSALMDAREHQPCALGDIIRALNPPTDLSRTPVTDVAFNFDRPMLVDEVNGLKMTASLPAKGASGWDLFLNVTDRGDQVELDCEFNSDIFKPETVQRFLEIYRVILYAVAFDVSLPLDKIPLLSAEEAERTLGFWNQTAQPFDLETTVHARFGEQAALTPEQTALIFEGEEMSYRALDERSNQLAHALIEAGVVPGMPVGIAMHRSFEMIIGLLGIIKAGGAYVPLDPNYP
ncbi:MAG: condensation domain-containing protein, partial [Chloroflexota bacterium]